MKIRYEMKTVLSRLHITTLRKQQVKPIDTILAGKETFVLAPTSSGKSAIYQIPAVLHHDYPTIVIEPTIALMHDQVHKLTSCGIAAAYLDSTMPHARQRKQFQQFQKGKVSILYITPERFASEDFLCVLQEMKLYMVVIDECHCVLNWGYSFRRDYLRIGGILDTLSHRPIVVALTATATADDIKQICKYLHMKRPVIF